MFGGEPDFSGRPWYGEPVYYLYYARVLSRVYGDFFEPGRSNSREEFAWVLANLAEKMGEPTRAEKLGAQTVGVPWAIRTGILQGKREGDYAQKDVLTREQMIVLMMRYADHAGLAIADSQQDLSRFADLDQVSDWARADVTRACQLGLVCGSEKEGATFLRPQAAATRAESAQIIWNYVQHTGFQLEYIFGGIMYPDGVFVPG